MASEIMFGGWLKQYRKDHGVRTDALAEQIGCSTIALLKIESGERRPSRQIALLLAKFLAIPDDEHEAFVTFARSGQAVEIEDRASGRSGAGPGPESLQMAGAPWRSARLYNTNLPHALTPLIGRDREVEEASKLLLRPQVRLLTFTGAPGIGKTHLALQVALHSLDHFGDGVFLVELATIDDPGYVLSSIARTLGLKESGGERIEEVLIGHAKERRMLLVLDNFEHLLDAAPSVASLLENSPWTKVLATSREALHVRGERHYSVQPLRTPTWPVSPGGMSGVRGPSGPEYEGRRPPSHSVQPQLAAPGGPPQRGHVPRQSMDTGLDVGALAAYPSVQLFVERAQGVDPNFALSKENGADVAALCVALEGLPLAIELAATRTKYQSPHEMRRALTSRLKLLTGGARDLPVRQRTLRSAIEWSYGLLSVEEQRLFRRLGVFMGGFTAEAVEAVGGHPEGEGTPVIEILYSLVDKNLVKRERADGTGEVRFGLLETIREYAREKLHESGTVEEEEAESAHALYFMELAEEAMPHLTGPEQVEWLGLLEGEYANIIEVMRWATRSAGPTAETEKRVQAGLRLVCALYDFWFIRGYHNEGRQWLEVMLSASSSLPADSVHSSLSPSAASAPSTPSRQPMTGDRPPLASRAFGGRSPVAGRQTVVRPLSAWRADALLDAGIFAIEQEDYTSANALLEEALTIYRRLGESRGVARVLGNLGVNALDQANYVQARRLLEEGLALWRELGDKRRIAFMLSNLGLVARMQGDLAKARLLHQESLDIFREVGDKRGISLSLQNLGADMAALGDDASALSFHEESLAIRRELGYRWGIATSLGILADIALKDSEYEKARLLYEESVQIFQELGSKRGVAWTMTGLADVAAESGQARLGAGMLGIAAALWEAAHVEPDDDAIIEHAKQAALLRLGEEEFNDAWAEGRAMSVQAALHQLHSVLR